MGLAEQRAVFEKNKRIYESAKVRFYGVDGFDVYNSSVPFEWQGKRYIFGRVERREEWANSWVRLFEQTGKDEWTLVPDSMIYQLEDPYIAIIQDELILGGTHVRKKQGSIDTYYGYFYKGRDIHNLEYFTTGPDYMKDIRLVQLDGSRIGVFSRPRSEAVRSKYGSESVIGFATFKDIGELSAEVIEGAPVIEGLFEKDEWGGCNQCYPLDSGLIGVTGHKCYKKPGQSGEEVLVYVNISFVFDPAGHQIMDSKIIGTRDCYPEGPAKKDSLVDCVFTSGIEMREDGRVDLYSGVNDVEVGRIVIDYPFEGYGRIKGDKAK